jgi:predicted RNA-binding protein with PIN domain
MGRVTTLRHHGRSSHNRVSRRLHMQYLIDGYNLLHVTNVFVKSVGPGSVGRLHVALLDFLASVLDPAECERTTVVFDAKGRLAGQRRTMQHAGIIVHYAARTEDADTLIAELIQDHHSPRNLTVVSSDHQVQRAAKRRRAKSVDSDAWYGELRRRIRERESQTTVTTDPSAVANPFPPEYLAEVTREIEQSNQRKNTRRSK